MLAWDKAEHGLDVAEMDATHAEFLALVALLSESDDTDFAGLFLKLVDHCRLHFLGEGRLMRISRFPPTSRCSRRRTRSTCSMRAAPSR